MIYAEELILQSLEYTVRMEEVRNIMWAIQGMYGKEAALEWRDEHLAKFN
jgi:hypothetical protein